MGTKMLRTTIAVSVATALLVSALAVYAVPRLMNPASPTTGLLQPALYSDSTTLPAADAQPAAAQPAVRRAVAPASYRQPYTRTTTATVRRQRSTQTSALIVAGSAGTGAAIGALAGGGKGAAIGAIAGGVGGLVYDRLTAHK